MMKDGFGESAIFFQDSQNIRTLQYGTDCPMDLLKTVSSKLSDHTSNAFAHQTNQIAFCYCLLIQFDWRAIISRTQTALFKMMFLVPPWS